MMAGSPLLLMWNLAIRVLPELSDLSKGFSNRCSHRRGRTRGSGMGATPQRAANCALVATRSGLSPIVISSVAAVTIPAPLVASRLGFRARQQQVPGQPEPGRPGLIGHLPRLRERPNPRLDFHVVRTQTPPVNLASLIVDRAANDATCVHIQTNTRTIS